MQTGITAAATASQPHVPDTKTQRQRPLPQKIPARFLTGSDRRHSAPSLARPELPDGSALTRARAEERRGA